MPLIIRVNRLLGTYLAGSMALMLVVSLLLERAIISLVLLPIYTMVLIWSVLSMPLVSVRARRYRCQPWPALPLSHSRTVT